LRAASVSLYFVNLAIRALEDRDYPRLAEIEAAIDPSRASSADLLRQRDAVREPRVRVLRLVAEHNSDDVVGHARVQHIWWNFNPRNYVMRIQVDPRWQRRGVGSGLFDRLLAQLLDWKAALVRCETRDSQAAAIAFLQHRAFREWRRRWESVLEVAKADTTALVAADRRATASGVSITTYASAQATLGERLAHDEWQLEDIIFRADPANTSEGEGMSFERFVATELEWSEALPEAHFLAFMGDRLVGVSRLARDQDRVGTLDQAFTGSHPDFRGLGIAQALKLRTIEYARQHGYAEIRTSNDSTNEPMLHINTTIGFRRGPATLIFERRLAT
jgi:mycothiol synthase